MDIGMPWWIGAGPPEEGLQAAADHGFDFLELSLDAPWPEGLDAAAVADGCQRTGVALGLHGPWRTQALAHPRAKLAQAACEVVADCLAWAQAAGAAYLVLHVDASHFARFPDPGTVQRGLEHATEHLARLADQAGAVELLVENTSTPLGTPEELARFLDEVPELGFCFDPGHALLAEGRGTKGATGDPAAWAAALGDRLTLVHAMDHVRVEDAVIDHLVPGAGQGDLGALMDLVDTSGCTRILLEAFYADLEGRPANTQDLVDGREALLGARSAASP